MLVKKALGCGSTASSFERCHSQSFIETSGPLLSSTSTWPAPIESVAVQAFSINESAVSVGI